MFLFAACMFDIDEDASGSTPAPGDSGSPTDTDETGDPGDSGDDSGHGPPTWDPVAEMLICNQGEDAPLYDAALLDAEVDREDVGFTSRLWDQLAGAGYVRGPYQWPSFEPTHHEPEYAACWIRQSEADLDTALGAAHPVAASLRAVAALQSHPFTEDPLVPGTDAEAALQRLVDAAGGGGDVTAVSQLPSDLAAALAPVFEALAVAIEAREAMVAAGEAVAGGRKLYNGAAGMVISGSAYLPDITDAAAADAHATWFTSAGPSTLLLPAAQLAYAIEAADLARFAGRDDAWSFATEAGTITISGSGDDEHALAEDEAQLLLLDLGGDDTYVDGAGANRDESNPVSVAIDLGGNDAYGYAIVPDDHDTEAVLPSDADGRGRSGSYFTSDSDVPRQGAGRLGIGMLLDLGGGNDTYASLRMSQGFGAHGVGVLYDDAGDDTYAAEAGAQGSGVFGYGLLLDGGGSDTYLAWAYSQGFGYVGSVGVLVDREGNDDYRADPGNAFGGTTLYGSPQLPGGEGNSSFCQGAGFGLRGDSYGLWLSGGLGLLRDASGDDSYVAGVFSEGTGYWEGTGLLSDGDGADQYDALYYMQGGSAHFATGLLHDGGGDDRYNQRFDSYYMHSGAGHDYSLGMLIDDSGDDVYGYGGLAVGASNCQGVGVFVDRDGADTYDARSTYSTGLGNHSGECASRTSHPSIGIFLDSGGDPDTYLWTEGDVRTPADNSTFGIEWNGTDDEHGGAVDGDGEAGF
jgi:hypothetical protein